MDFMMMMLQIVSTASTPEAAQVSILDLLLKGGYVMLPILALSLISVYVFIERFFYIKNAATIDRVYLDRVKQKVLEGNIKGALDYCSDHKYPIATVLSRGIARLGTPVRDIESSLAQSAGIEIAKMEERLTYLSAIATIAPMFGFLGTVIGMIKAFYNISIADNISIGIIAGGIYEKMVTSASGLIVGIIAYIFYTILSNKIDKAVTGMETATSDFLDILYKPSV